MLNDTVVNLDELISIADELYDGDDRFLKEIYLNGDGTKEGCLEILKTKLTKQLSVAEVDMVKNDLGFYTVVKDNNVNHLYAYYVNRKNRDRKDEFFSNIERKYTNLVSSVYTNNIPAINLHYSRGYVEVNRGSDGHDYITFKIN